MGFIFSYSYSCSASTVQSTYRELSAFQACARKQNFARRQVVKTVTLATLANVLNWLPKQTLAARQEGVNRPELLPDGPVTTVLDLENFLASGEEKSLKAKIADLESRTGFKIRVLTQRFPQTPGLAVRDYWGIDPFSVLLVADYFGGSQLLKFNVGAEVDKLLPPRFWSLLSSNLGNKFYVEKNGENGAILTAVDNIRLCLLKNGCNAPPYLSDRI